MRGPAPALLASQLHCEVSAFRRAPARGVQRAGGWTWPPVPSPTPACSVAPSASYVCPFCSSLLQPEPTASAALASAARPSSPCWWFWRASALAASAPSSSWPLVSFEPRVKRAPHTWTAAGLNWAVVRRMVGHFGVQEDHMDLRTVHVESHLMDPDMAVPMMRPLEEHGLMTITMDSTLEEPPPPPE